MAESGEPLPLDAIPLLCEGMDFTGLEITAEEGFLLSRIDGVSNVDLLCSGSGLGREKTMRLLVSLFEKEVFVLHGHAEEKACDQEQEPVEEEAVPPEEEQEDEKDSPQEEGAGSESPQVLDLSELKKRLKTDLKRDKELMALSEAIFVNLENLSYYDLLGLTAGAKGGMIKKAYLKRTKVFHPDRFYRKVDGEFKSKVQEIFKQLNAGYRVLSDAQAKAEYDESLGIDGTMEEVEETEDVVAEPISTSSRTRTVKGQASPWKQIRVAKQKPIEERVRKKKEEKKKSKPVPEGKKLKLGLKDGKSARISPLLRKIEKMEAKGEGKEAKEQAARLFKGAMVEREKGNFKAARVNLQLAVQYDPYNKKYKEVLDNLEKDEEGMRGELEYKAGLDAQKNGDLMAAARHFRESLRLGYENSRLYHRLAELMMELDSNYERARALCLKAIEMEADVPEYHMALARAYKGLGQNPAAIVQLEKVLKLEPKNKIVAKELKALKRG